MRLQLIFFSQFCYRHDIGGERNLAQQELNDCGWELIDWFPRPGLGRHSGLARLYVDVNDTTTMTLS